MTNKKQGNPYAFPQSNDNNEMHDDYNGMLLRDYFAAKAMHGLVCNAGIAENPSHTGPTSCEKISKKAYRMADAMLKERLKPTQ